MKSSKFGILAIVSAFVIAKSTHFSTASRILLFVSGTYLLISTVAEGVRYFKTREVENE